MVITLNGKIYSGDVWLSDEDADLAALRWRVKFCKKLYVARSVGTESRTEYLHRVIAERMIGRKIERHEHVDHINADGLDNRRENLRVVTAHENMRATQFKKKAEEPFL